MKIYSFDFDADIYQTFTWKYDPTNEDWFRFDGAKKGYNWRPEQDIYIQNPMDEKGDFIGFLHEIVLTEKALKILRPILQPCSQFIHFTYEGEKYTLANVLEKGEYLDHDKVDFKWYDLSRQSRK